MIQLQCYITTFELDHRYFERKPQIHQLSNKFPFEMEEVFETLETSDVDMATNVSSKMVETVFNHTFYHYNGPNQLQRVFKHTGQKHQSISLQISRNISPPYLKENCLACVFKNN